ncbi:MAG TPA: hypothetical protein VGB82_19025 [Alphaproteobacteria bacterium]
MNKRLIAVASVGLMSIGLAACHRDRTVVVQPAPAAAAPAPNTTVVNPPATTRVCPAGAVTC